MALAEPLQSHLLFANLYREFSAVYEAEGNFKKALEYDRKLAVETDTVLGEKARQQFSALNARYDSERRVQEIIRLRQEQALQESAQLRERWQHYGLLGAFALGAIALAAVISRQRLNLRVKKRILAKTLVAKEAAEEAGRVKTRFLG